MGRQAVAVEGEEAFVVGEPGVQHRVEVHRPAVVVVELAAVAVGVPAVADVPLLDAVEAFVDHPARQLGFVADLLQKAPDRHREQLPVAGPGFGGERVAEPGRRPLSYGVVEAVPEQFPGHAEREGDRRGLHQGLAAVLDARPDARDTGREPVRVPREGLLVATEGGEEQRAGVSLQAVREPARPARAVARQVVQRAVGGRVRLHGRQQRVGGGLPVGAGVAGVRAEGAVVVGLGGHVVRFLEWEVRGAG